LVSRSAKSISGESLGREGAAPAAQTQGAAPSGLGREGTGGLGRMTTSASSGLGREGATGLGRMPHSSGTALGREGATGLGPMPSSSRSGLGREGERTRRQRPSSLEIGAAATRPAGSPYGARVGRAGLVSADRESILQGLIWHEILKEAPGKRLLRRTRSRPQ